jgi:hypothetical protein
VNGSDDRRQTAEVADYKAVVAKPTLGCAKSLGFANHGHTWTFT